MNIGCAAVMVAFALAPLAALAPLEARAEVVPTVSEEAGSPRGYVAGSGQFTFVSRTPLSLMGPGLTINGGVWLSKGVGVGVSFSQTYSAADRFVAFLTSAALEGRFVVAGSLHRASRTVRVDGQPLLEAQGLPEAGLAVVVSAQQSFLNASSQVYPFSGFGLGLEGVKALSRSVSLVAGLRGQMLTNGSSTLSIGMASLGVTTSF